MKADPAPAKAALFSILVNFPSVISLSWDLGSLTSMIVLANKLGFDLSESPMNVPFSGSSVNFEKST